eukprot:UN19514
MIKVVQSLMKVFQSTGEEFYNLSFTERRSWFKKHNHEPFWCIFPTICFATSAVLLNNALLSPVVEFFRYRYDCESDGCVTKADAVLPGSCVVYCDDADHYCPAWNSFPALDRYNSTLIVFILLQLAIEKP